MTTKYLDFQFEIKSIQNEDPDYFQFEGLASTFGNVDNHEDIVLPGAFKKSLTEREPVILWQHDSRQPIGMPIEVRETEEGLYLKAKLPRKDEFVKGRVIPQIEVGSIRTMSIGYRTIESEYNSDTDVRLLKEVKLYEISLVTFPSNELAKVSGFKDSTTKLTVEQVKEFTPRELENALRESGMFSKHAAVYLSGKFAEQGEPEGKTVAIDGLKSISTKLDAFNKKQSNRKTT